MTFKRNTVLKAIATTDMVNAHVLKNECFSVCKRIDIGSAATINIIMNPTSCTKKNILLTSMEWTAFGAGPIFVDVYANPTYGTDGDDLTAINRNHESAITPEMFFLINPFIDNDGSKIPAEFAILSDGTPATASTGGRLTDETLCQIDRTRVYLFRLVNQEASPTTGATLFFNWIETNL